ncbi:hypothetical protein WNY78_03370 [Psychroserpens sp. AS72]|uniref:HYC_CC_PP family protein n=1 Tax=Psychroserpens sp. AS72 TaxID=3135775 RepID=UPI0031811D51
MLKQILHKVFSMMMAVLLLLSTVSFTVEKHFCGDVLIDVAVFSTIEKCASDAVEMVEEHVSKKTCCKDTLDVIEGQTQLTVKTFDDLDFEQQQFLVAYVHAFNNLFEVVQKHTIPHQYYNSPKLIADIHVLDQVFLI